MAPVLGALLLPAVALAKEWVVPARKAAVENPIPANEAGLKTARKIYRKECQSCHGETGKGDGPGAKEHKTQPVPFDDPGVVSLSDGALFWKMTIGRKPMPGFKKLLTDNERWQLVNFMRTMMTTSKEAH